MKPRTVERVFPPAPPHQVGDGFTVHNYFPSGYRIGKQRMSPFFLLDYGAKTLISPSPVARGVGSHPHRGFETVTLAYHGKVAHHDSYGNRGVIAEGDAQWMTAGSGVLHKEYHEKEFSRTGGLLQMVQLWVNLPARHKLTNPKYQALVKDGMGRHDLPGGNGQVNVIAGEYLGVKGPASTFSPVHLYSARLRKGAAFDFSFPESYNAALLVIEGAVRVNGTDEAPADHFVLFRNDGEDAGVIAEEDSVVLVLAGEPIDEPVVAYGPFVMNTQQELVDAVNDFNEGKFGQLDD